MHPYQVEDVRLKGLWARHEWREESRPPGVSIADCARLEFVDRWGSAVLIQRWVSGGITWRKLWRIASDHAGDSVAQLAAVKPRT